MRHFGIPRHNQSMIAYDISTEYFSKILFGSKLHCGNVVSIPYSNGE